MAARVVRRAARSARRWVQLAYIQESRRCDQIVAARGLDEAGANVERTLRWILHHLIEETTRHLGHLDLLRELGDGQRS